MTSGTIAVCTRNRSALLAGCLASLDRLLADDLDLDVVVVDNGSDDDTPAVVAEWQAQGPGRRSVVATPTGLVPARNAALQAAVGEVVLFLDDDALVPPTWAAAHLAAYDGHPAVGAVGGPVGLVWPAGRPGWVSEPLTQWLSALDLGDEAGLYPNPHGPYGTNMSVRRTAALAVGGFDPRFGRRGRRLLSGEERDLSRRLVDAGWELRYAPEAAVVQQVLPERLHKRWFLRRGWAQGVSNARFDLAAAPAARRERWAGAATEVRTSIDLFRGRRTGEEADELAALVLVLAHAGHAAELVRPSRGPGR